MIVCACVSARGGRTAEIPPKNARERNMNSRWHSSRRCIGTFFFIGIHCRTFVTCGKTLTASSTPIARKPNAQKSGTMMSVAESDLLGSMRAFARVWRMTSVTREKTSSMNAAVRVVCDGTRREGAKAQVSGIEAGGGCAGGAEAASRE